MNWLIDWWLETGPTPNSWTAVLLSGFAGALLTLSVQGIIHWWRKPVLRLLFTEKVRGCRVATPAWNFQDQQTGVIGTSAEQAYLRLKVANPGRTFAKNVSVCVTHIAFADGTPFSEEVLDLKVALTSDRDNFNLASKGHRFVDFAHCDRRNHATALHFDFAIIPARLHERRLGPGRYEMQVFASAENAASVHASCRFQWDGTLEGLRIV
jgi:hypothetical protein